jgi:vesicle-fusing ATPase
MIVASMNVVELPNQQNNSRVGNQPHMEMGVVMDRTDVTVMKASDSMIKIKSSAKK